MTEERFARLETALAHHEQQIQDLSDIIHRQHAEIEALKARLDKTQRKLVDLEVSDAGGAAGAEGLSVTEQALRDKPPHY